MPEATPSNSTIFDQREREAVYRVIAERRDMRHFKPDSTIAPDVLLRMLGAAHQAPSVGLMQPWRFIRISDTALRGAIADLVEQERLLTAKALGGRQDEFLSLKVEGVRECAELFVVALAPDDGTVFGRRTMPREMAVSSVACAIQNLWLASRAENLGLGWVSMFEPAELGALLKLPEGSQALAILCLGPVDSFYIQPMLREEHWRDAVSLDTLCFDNHWPDQPRDKVD
ncbi:MAG: 5,6-dimethylbenzimidazole synthase [Granulosicoccaceae bacterium]